MFYFNIQKNSVRFLPLPWLQRTDEYHYFTVCTSSILYGLNIKASDSEAEDCWDLHRQRDPDGNQEETLCHKGTV